MWRIFICIKNDSRMKTDQWLDVTQGRIQIYKSHKGVHIISIRGGGQIGCDTR